MGLAFPMIDAMAAVSTSIEVVIVEAACVEDNPVTPEVDGFEEAGVPSETVPAEAVSKVGVLMVFPEDGSVEWELGIACEGTTASSAMDSSDESDIRSTVEGILDGLVGKQRSRKCNNDLLALEAMRSI